MDRRPARGIQPKQRSVVSFFGQKENRDTAKAKVASAKHEIKPVSGPGHALPAASPAPAGPAGATRTLTSSQPSLGSQTNRPTWWSGSSFTDGAKPAQPFISRDKAPVLSGKRKEFEFSSSQPTKRPSGILGTGKPGSGGSETGGHLSGQNRSLGRKLMAPRRSGAAETGDLSDEQQKVLDRIMRGESLFFTGAAGTGKSFLLQRIILNLHKKLRDPDAIAVTATTGLAALNIGGQTIHRWANIGLGDKAVHGLVQSINRSRDGKERWQRVKVLIIDEVSMLEAGLFEKLEEIARQLKKVNRPFGGIQVILTGDFFQLPPVVKNAQGRLCFEAECWPRVISCTMLLVKVFRQKNDDRLVGMLNALREGRLTADHVAAFKALDRPVFYDDGLEATELFALRSQVERANQMRMTNIKAKLFHYEARDTASGAYDADKMLENVMAVKQLDLKIGAQVLLIQNQQTNRLVNGSRGVIVTFVSEQATLGLFELDDRTGGLALKLYNRLLESDGTVDDDLRKTIESHLSREQQETLVKLFTSGPKYPCVDFGSENSRVVIQPAAFEIKGPAPKFDTIASRVQIPLILSWALSIHKAQGQTLDRVIVDLRKVFEKGQVYVALSRATKYSQLQVIGFDENRVQVDQRVIKFYDQMIAQTKT